VEAEAIAYLTFCLMTAEANIILETGTHPGKIRKEEFMIMCIGGFEIEQVHGYKPFTITLN
jgi:hypothetical protein